MNFSIIIPAQNTEYLKDCFESLAQLNYPKNDYEVIVVDDTTDGQLEQIVEPHGFAAVTPFDTGFRGVEPRTESHSSTALQPWLSGAWVKKYSFIYKKTSGNRGSYAARNTGLRHARGKFFAFTDADCIVHPRWLIELENAFHAGADAVLGFSKGHNANKVAEYEQRMYEENLHKIVANPANIARLDTRNCAIHRQVYERLGGFDDRLLFGGDWEYGSLIHNSGMKIHFCPTAIVTHINPTDLKKIIQKRLKQNTETMRVTILHDAKFNSKYFYQLIPKKSFPQLKLYAYKFLLFLLHNLLWPIHPNYLLFKAINVTVIKLGRLKFILKNI